MIGPYTWNGPPPNVYLDPPYIEEEKDTRFFPIKHSFMSIRRYIWLMVHGLCWGMLLPLSGQESVERVEGEASWGRYSGQATYHFYRDEAGDTVLQGAFSLRSAGLEVSPFGSQPYLSFRGHFEAGRLDSSWQIQFGDFEAGTDLVWVDHHFEVSVEGRLHTAEATFEAGEAEGQWSHLVERIENAESIDTVLSSTFQVVAGRPADAFRLEDTHLILLGRFQSQGLAHDVWTFNYKETVNKLEHWSFVDGRLTALRFEHGEERDSLSVYSDTLVRTQTIPLDERYLRILALQGRFDSSAYVRLGGRGRALLLEHASLQARTDHVMAALDTTQQPPHGPRIGVTVAYFPSTEQEARQIDTIRTRLRSIDSTSQRLLANTRLKLLARTDEEVAFYRAVADSLAGPYLSPARQLLTYHEEGLLDFVPRERLWPDHDGRDTTWPVIAVAPRDTGEFQPRRFEGPAVAYPNDTSTLVYLMGLCQYGQATLDSIEHTLDQKLDRQAFQAELESLEKDLLQESDDMDRLVDSLAQVLPAPITPSLMALKRLAKERLRQYSDETQLKPKLTLVQNSIRCIRQLQQLALALAKLPSRRETLQQLYTEEVWNPFTATTMEDQVKERLTQAYEKVLIPYLLSEIEQNLRCEQVEAKIATLDALYQRMQQLRTEKTSQLERKLRRPPDPETVLEWFELSL